MDIAIAKDRLASVVKPDSITASQGDFLATHVAIKKLVMLNKFEFVPTSEKYMSEEDIYKKFIVNPSNKHQFIVVYGQSGTGKSHLIRWFEARYKADRPDDEVVLFIRRSDNTLREQFVSCWINQRFRISGIKRLLSVSQTLLRLFQKIN